MAVFDVFARAVHDVDAAMAFEFSQGCTKMVSSRPDFSRACTKSNLACHLIAHAHDNIACNPEDRLKHRFSP
eukprot:4683418-Amphidinium_carterae.1